MPDTPSIFDGPLRPLRPLAGTHHIDSADAAASDRDAPQPRSASSSPSDLPALPDASARELNTVSPRDASEKSEIKDPPIRARHRWRKFISALLCQPDRGEAARRRAYCAAYPKASPKAAALSAGKLLLHPWVAREIERLEAVRAEAAALKAGEMIAGLSQIAALDIRSLYREDGSVLEPHELPPEVARVLEIERWSKRAGISLRAPSRVAAYELLAKIGGLTREPERPPIVANIQINF